MQADEPLLTERQREIVDLMQQGVRTNRALARALGVTTDTVSAQLRVIFRHLGVHSRVELAAALGDPEPGPGLAER